MTKEKLINKLTESIKYLEDSSDEFYELGDYKIGESFENDADVLKVLKQDIIDRFDDTEDNDIMFEYITKEYTDYPMTLVENILRQGVPYDGS